MDKKGGGVTILFNATFQCRKILFGDFSSFEYVAVQSRASYHAVFLTIRRPQNIMHYFLLSALSLSVVLVGDIHVDNVKDGCAKELLNILDIFGLSRHVTDPTHNKGHTLDLIISKGLNISDAVVTDVALSDHYCVPFKMTIPASISKGEAEVMRKRSININTCTLFTQAFTPSPVLPSASVNDLANSFSSSVITVMDAIALIKTKVISGRKKSPWRNATLVKAQKRECRQAEHRWQKNKLQVHYDIYKDSLYKN